MFRKRTVFVIGAGAGFDLGMPLGANLAETIARSLDIRYEYGRNPIGSGDHQIIDALKHAKIGNVNDYRSAGIKIRDGIVLANSIDDFLDLHQASPLVVTMGKLAIARTILKAEARSKLALKKHESGRPRIDFRALADSWLAIFMKTLAPGTRNPDHLFEKVTFINFNYDRCLEHFLENALPPLFDIEEGRAIAICQTAKILHPYGSIGPLPSWEDGQHTIAFGEDCVDDRILTAAKHIKTYTEQMTDTGVRDSMRTAIREAQQIIFLGFAFHTPNMTLLTPKDPGPGAQVFATAIGIGEEDRRLVRDDIGRLFSSHTWTEPAFGNVRIRDDIDCAKLFIQYHKTLQRNPDPLEGDVIQG